MKQTGLALSACLAVACGGAPLRESVPPADIVFVNGEVLTMSAGGEPAQALAVRGERIVYVGTATGAQALRGPGTRTIDLEGHTVLPGFHDSHVHPVTGGVEYLQCNVNDLESVDEVLAAVAECAQKPGSWIVGGGWSLPLFSKAGPDARELDAVVRDRPVFLTGADGHSAWVNSLALQTAGIGRKTPDPPGGRIERRADGTPSGTLREAAVHLVDKLIPPPSRCDHVRGLYFAQSMAHRFGITSVTEANATPSVLDAYRTVARAGGLFLRVVAAQHLDLDKGASDVERLVRQREAYRAPGFRPTAAKIFLDGVIEGHTAALLTEYADTPGKRGELNTSPEALRDIVRALDAAGLDIHIHAIGDRAIRVALDALEAGVRRPDARPTIAHLQLIDPLDIPRFAQLGVSANFQALWAWKDPYITDLTLPFIGAARGRWLYPIKSVAAAGARIVGGSDWSVSSMDPLSAISVGLRRVSPDKEEGEAFIPQERVDLETMLRAYTREGAYQHRQEHVVGTLETGKEADLVVLDRRLRADPLHVHEARVLVTMFRGTVVYRAEDAPWSFDVVTPPKSPACP